MAKVHFLSPVSNDPLEIIIICQIDVQETFLTTFINVENIVCNIFVCKYYYIYFLMNIKFKRTALIER